MVVYRRDIGKVARQVVEVGMLAKLIAKKAQIRLPDYYDRSTSAGSQSVMQSCAIRSVKRDPARRGGGPVSFGIEDVSISMSAVIEHCGCSGPPGASSVSEPLGATS